MPYKHCLGPPWTSIVGAHFGPFAGRPPEIQREVTRKVWELREPRIRLRQGSGVTSCVDITDKDKLRKPKETNTAIIWEISRAEVGIFQQKETPKALRAGEGSELSETVGSEPIFVSFVIFC